tara:strand:- start:85 stop:615 length:531 start_codon:yes stop_codon:yes gene_type:complete
MAEGTSTTRSTSATGPLRLDGRRTTGTAGSAVGANANILVISTENTTEWLVDREGDTHYNGSDNAGAWDDYDDVELLTAKRIVTQKDRRWAQKKFGTFVNDHAQVLHDTGVITLNDDGHHFVSTKGLNALIIDAIRQTRNIQKAFYNSLPKSQQARFASELQAMALPVLPAFQQTV